MSARLLTTDPEPYLEANAALDAPEPLVAVTRKIAPPLSFAPYFDVNTPLPGERNPQALGYITDLSEDLYRKWPGINSSTLKQATPCEMLHSLSDGKPRSWNGVTLGLVLHMAVLEPWKLEQSQRDRFLMLCPTEGLDTKKANECRAENPGKLLVNQEIMEAVHGCMGAVQANPKALSMLEADGRHTEATAIVWDAEFGIWRKARYDVMTPGTDYLADVKTTSAKLDARSWERECWKYGYFHQAAWYLHTHWLLTGERRRYFRWLVLTNTAPFMCRTFYLINRQASDPLYEESSLRKARQSLGLDADSLRIGRLQMFINSALETEDFRARGVEMTPALMRQTWPGYEQESPEPEIL